MEDVFVRMMWLWAVFHSNIESITAPSTVSPPTDTLVLFTILSHSLKNRQHIGLLN